MSATPVDTTLEIGASRKTLTSIACVLFSVMVWAGWVVASRFAVKGTLTAYDITAIRFGVSGLLLLPVAIRRGLAIGPWGRLSGLLIATLMGAPYTNIAVAGMVFAGAVHGSTIINGSLLVLTTLAGIVWLREPTSKLKLAGVALSISGIGCILAAHGIHDDARQWIGHILFVISGLMWGSYIVLARAWKLEPIHATAVIAVFSMILYLPLYFLFAPSHLLQAGWHEVVFQGFYQGVLTAIVALLAFNYAIAHLGASRAGAFTPLVPVLATLLAIVVLHEFPTPLEWAGVACVSLGVLLASGILHIKKQRALSSF